LGNLSFGEGQDGVRSETLGTVRERVGVSGSERFLRKTTMGKEIPEGEQKQPMKVGQKTSLGGKRTCFVLTDAKRSREGMCGIAKAKKKGEADFHVNAVTTLTVRTTFTKKKKVRHENHKEKKKGVGGKEREVLFQGGEKFWVGG